MAAVSSFFNNFDFSKFQIKVIVDNDHIFKGYFKIGRYPLKGEPASVHIRKGFGKDKSCIVYSATGIQGIKPGLFKGEGKHGGQLVYYKKADIMAGASILFSRVAQPRHHKYRFAGHF